MREQLDHLVHLSAQPHITLQVLPHDVGAHPGVSGQFALLEFADATDVSVVYLERFTSDLYLEKRSDVLLYSDMYAHLQAQALSPVSTRRFIDEVVKTYGRTEFLPDPCPLSLSTRDRRPGQGVQRVQAPCPSTS